MEDGLQRAGGAAQRGEMSRARARILVDSPMPCLFGTRRKPRVRDDATVEEGDGGGREVSSRYAAADRGEVVGARSDGHERSPVHRSRRQFDLHDRTPAHAAPNGLSPSRSSERPSDSAVGQWLIRVEPSLGKRYFQAFRDEGFDSLSAVQTLTEGDLIDMDVKAGHRRVLLPAIAILKERFQHIPTTNIDQPVTRTTSMLQSPTGHQTNLSVQRSPTGSPQAAEFPPLPLAGSRSPARLPAGTSGVPDRVAAFLRRLPGGMAGYGPILMRSGFDSLESICLMDADDIASIIPAHKAGHKKVFKKALEHLQIRMGGVTEEESDSHPGLQQRDEPDPMLMTSRSLVNVPSSSSSRALTTASQPSNNGRTHSQLLPADGIRVQKGSITSMAHIYVLSGRDRVPTHMKRHIGDGKYRRWDVFEHSTERYNYITDSWSSVNVDPCWGAGVATGDGDGHIFSLTGFGWSPTDGLVDMPLPSVETRTWGALCWTSANFDDRHQSSGGLVFAAGGYGPGGLTQTVDVYDVDRGAWSNVNPLRTARHSLAMAGTQGRYSVGTVYAVGGSRGGNQSSTSAGGRKALSIVEAFDVGSDRWTQLGRDMSTPRLGASAVCTNGAIGGGRSGDCLFVLGGSNTTSKALRLVEFYDPRVGTWATLRPMIKGRAFFGAAVLPTGDIMAVGGKKGQQWLTSCEIFDSRKGVWRVAASLDKTRHAVPHTTYVSGTAKGSGGRRPRGYSVAIA